MKAWKAADAMAINGVDHVPLVGYTGVLESVQWAVTVLPEHKCMRNSRKSGISSPQPHIGQWRVSPGEWAVGLGHSPVLGCIGRPALSHRESSTTKDRGDNLLVVETWSPGDHTDGESRAKRARGI